MAYPKKLSGSEVKNNKIPPDIYVMPLALNNEKYFKNPKYTQSS